MGFCSHNPLVPGSSPGGPTRNENTNLRVGIYYCTGKFQTPTVMILLAQIYPIDLGYEMTSTRKQNFSSHLFPYRRHVF